jgi:hypothetical protein
LRREIKKDDRKRKPELIKTNSERTEKNNTTATGRHREQGGARACGVQRRTREQHKTQRTKPKTALAETPAPRPV